MDKHEWASFLRFLNEANEAELARRKDRLLKTLEIVTADHVRSDIHRMSRLIDEEVLIRQNLSTRKSTRRLTKG